MNCTLHIQVEYNDASDFIQITPYLTYPLNEVGIEILEITNCKNDNNLLLYNDDAGSYDSFIIQEIELCVNFQTDSRFSCSIDSDCDWDIAFYYLPHLGPIVIELNVENPISLISIGFQNVYFDPFHTYTGKSPNGSIEAWLVNGYKNNDLDFLRSLDFVIYSSANLSEFSGIKRFTNISIFNISSNGADMTILISNNVALSFNHAEVQICFRDSVLHSANCDTKENLRFAFPTNQLFNINITALQLGNCLLSIIPFTSSIINNIYNNGEQPYYVHILHVLNIVYRGEGTVRVISGYNNTLFEFSQETSSLWNDTTVFGNLISFIIPPNGHLYLEYESLDTINDTLKIIDSHGAGIIQSETYQNPSYGQSLSRMIKCHNQNGYASYKMYIVFAEINYDGYLQIFSGEQMILYITEAKIIQNMTIPLFNGTEVVVDYEQGSNLTRGILIRYEGIFVPFEEPKSPLKQYLLWYILVPSLVLASMALILLTCYAYHVKKNRRRMDFIIDIMIKQKQLSPEEIEEFKIKRDEFTILKKNLKIYYEFPLGQGASSSVYVGFLYGQSPLMVSTGLIETQRFQDCKVAVKVPSSFGQDETEQLFREIDSMKKIGYHKHVICMLGISLLSEKPAVVFDLAEKDLLGYVRSLKETIFGQIQAPTNIFFSILWQVARGMQYISSKNIVHRDLAARNVLLTDSFNAKIADFGLSFSTDSGSPSTTDLPKKLPIKWLAIEALLNKLFSQKSDVWAFGVLIYEVFSLGLVPYKDLTTEDLVDYLRNGNRLECPEAANKETYEMMLCCWKEDHDERPTFEQLVNQLREILKTTTMTYSYVESKEG